MDVEPERSGRIDYASQGFSLHWDQTGLQVQVTDYHAKTLRLSWGQLLALARLAGAPDAPAE
jgi:hypothetical protein